MKSQRAIMDVQLSLTPVDIGKASLVITYVANHRKVCIRTQTSDERAHVLRGFLGELCWPQTGLIRFWANSGEHLTANSTRACVP